MSFFPSDWEDDDFDENEDGFQGDVDSLVNDFENKSRESFTAKELIEKQGSGRNVSYSIKWLIE